MLPSGLKESGGMPFRLEELRGTVSAKTYESTDRPSECYIEVAFPDHGYLSYILFQNFYTYSITIKQGFSAASGGPVAKWKTILRNYKLMKSPHFEGDAQNWHMIKTEKAFSRG